MVISYAPPYSLVTPDRTEIRIMQKDVWNVGYEDLILSDSSLVGYWRLGEKYASYSAQDISPTKNNSGSTIGGTPITQASPAAILGDSENTAWTFDSANPDYVRITDNDVYSPTTSTKLTVEAWTKPTNTTSGSVVSKGDDSNFEWELNRYYFSASVNGYQAILRSSDGTNIAEVTLDGFGAIAPDDQWAYIVMTIDTVSEELVLRVNDLYTGSDTSWGGGMTNGTSELEMAHRRDNTLYYDGIIDEVAIYSDILTASEITEHYNKAKETYYSNTIKATPGLSGYWRLGTASGTIAYDESGNGNNGTYDSNIALGVNGATGSDWDTAATFSGQTAAKVTIPDDDALDFGYGDYSLEAWIKRSALPARGEFIMGHDGGGA